MKRCPKCNRTYSTDTQKFCTHDGGLLFTIDAGLNQTVQFDSSNVRDAVQKPTTRDLGEQKPADFDPEATVVTTVDDGTKQIKTRDTGSLETPGPTQQQMAPPPSLTSELISSTQSTPPPPPESTGPSASSAPLPPAVTPSGPIATSAPLPPPQAGSSRPLAASAPKKKSKLPLILGLVAVVLVILVGAAAVAGYFFVIKPRQEARRVVAPTISSEPSRPSVATTATPSEPSKPSNEPPPYEAPADAVQFVNAKENLSNKLADNFVAFSFYYPERWVKVPSTENFVTVERRLPPDFTQERFGVAPWYASPDTTTYDNAFFQTLVAKDDANFAKNYPEYRKVSEGPTKVGSYDAYELRFESISRGTDKGDLTLWGREIFFAPREGEKTGVKFLILTTSLAPELKSIDDIGVKGELPMLLDSFRFGK